MALMLFLVIFLLSYYIHDVYSFSIKSNFNIHTIKPNNKVLISSKLNKLLILYSEFERSEPVYKKQVIDEESSTSITKSNDDEEDEKPRLSEAMKQKLRKELISQGADPNYSAGPILGNPILLISGVIAILVLIGGKGYFF